MVKFIFILIFFSNGYSSELSNDVSTISTIDNYPKRLVLTGTLATLLLVSNRNKSDRIQEYMYREEPLGEFSKYGDYLGQLIPNLSYIIYKNLVYKNTDDQYFRARNSMFKATLYAGVTTGILKRVFNQRRPHNDDNLSFPSGHTTTAFAFAGVVSYYESKPVTIAAYGIASFVALSRMQDNAHYLHDIVAGATIGLSFAHLFSNHESKMNEVAFLPITSKDRYGVQFMMLFE